jgi:hypothetical protein
MTAMKLVFSLAFGLSIANVARLGTYGGERLGIGLGIALVPIAVAALQHLWRTRRPVPGDDKPDRPESRG